MKEKIFALVAISFAFLLASSIPSNSAYVSGRETVTLTGGTFDMNAVNSNLYSPAGGAGTNVTGNLTLPCKISELDTVNLTVYNGETTPIRVNFTVNGIKLFDDVTISAGSSVTKTLNDYTTAGGDVNLTYFAWSGNCNQTDNEYFNITIIANDAHFYDVSKFASVTEEVRTTPHIEMNKDDTWYSVTDRIEFHNTLSYNLTDIVVTFSYPFQALNPNVHNVTFSSVVHGEKEYRYVYYQKQGPYVRSIGNPSKDVYGDYELYMRVKAYEDEDNVTWTIDPTSSEWRDYFPQLDTNSLHIYINGEEISFTTGSIHMTGIKLDDGLNDVEMKWTPASAPTPITPTGGETQLYMYLAIILVVVFIIAMLLLVSYGKK